MIDLKCGDTTYPMQLAPEQVRAVIRPPIGTPAGTPEQDFRFHLRSLDEQGESDVSETRFAAPEDGE